jgi:hypothetical protein
MITAHQRRVPRGEHPHRHRRAEHHQQAKQDPVEAGSDLVRDRFPEQVPCSGRVTSSQVRRCSLIAVMKVTA